MFPDPDMPGVDLVLPDFSYLRENADRVDGIVLTHGHEDHTGGLAYLLRELRVPIYGSALTLGLARHRVEEAGLCDRAEFIAVADGERRRIGPCDVEFIPVTHSVPNAFAIAFHTPQGVILHSGDFKLDLHPVDGRRTDLARIGRAGRGPGHPAAALRLDQRRGARASPPSESSVGVDPAAGLPAAAGPAGHRRPASPATSTASSRSSTPRWPAAAGWPPSGARCARTWTWPGASASCASPTAPWSTSRRSSNLDPGEVCVLSTGSQGEPMSALSLMATGDNKWLQIEDGDVVVISAHPIPGNEWSVGRVIDELHRRGAEVVHSGHEAVHVSGHARQGELATLMSVARPRRFVPVHGEYRHMVHHARLAVPWASTPTRCCSARTVTPSCSTPRGCAATARCRRATSTWTARSATSATGSSGTAACSPKRAW